MAGGSGGGERPLTDTPTWAVALVCAVIVIISVVIEHGIQMLHKLFQKRQKKAMMEALEKIKAELMLLGFISLLLTVGQSYIAKICIPSKFGHSMLPCKNGPHDESGAKGDDRRKLLWLGSQEPSWRRVLAAGASAGDCSQYQDKVSLISRTGIHQLHIFIFVLAVFHVLYSAMTMGFAHAKMRTWKTWESETNSLEYKFSNDPARFRLTHQTSFVRRHVGLSSTPGIKWIVAFLRQFFGSVTKVDYLTMRHGFINAHLSPNSKFNFQKYIKRSLEDDFKIVVGISLPLWFLAIVMMLLNVYGLYTLYWMSFIPLLILLLVGMKLEMVIMEMAHQIQERATVVKGAPIVVPSNRFFWFNHPKWTLYLIHFTLFENAFQVAHFLWTWYSFGLKTCFHASLAITIARVLMGLALQFVCSYITFPLYALVTQMGSHMKKAIFEEQTAKALDKWQRVAKERRKLRETGADSHSGYLSGGETPSQGSSPIHLLHKYKSNSTDVESVMNSPRYCQSDNDVSEMETPPFTKFQDPESRRLPPKKNEEYAATCDFTFSTAS
uniref:MLO-like protein n=1 Tax=Anthurium amnicola TaxID=1678845 RepID=A0A1D1XEP3_9ARAE